MDVSATLAALDTHRHETGPQIPDEVTRSRPATIPHRQQRQSTASALTLLSINARRGCLASTIRFGAFAGKTLTASGMVGFFGNPH